MAEAGAVHVLYGSAGRADGRRQPALDAGERRRPRRPGRSDERFGRPLAAGDFGHGPQDDLAIAIADVERGRCVAGRRGERPVRHRATACESTGAPAVGRRASPGVPGVPGHEEDFGAAIAAREPGEGPASPTSPSASPQDHVGAARATSGAILVLFGSAGRALSTTGPLSPSTRTTSGTPVGAARPVRAARSPPGTSAGVRRPTSPSGAPGAAVDGVEAAGAVFVVFGGSNGLSA